MRQPPVRDSLSQYLRKRQDSVLRRLMALVAEAPELENIRELVSSAESSRTIAVFLDLLVKNLADPGERHCFTYARQRVFAPFRGDINETQMLRIAALHRRVLLKMIARHFANEPQMVERMKEIIDSQMEEIEMTFRESYRAARDEAWGVSESKYFSLFENASEAILSFRPGEGRIIEVNAQAERLMGKSRELLFGRPFAELFDHAHREQAQWLVSQQGGASNIRLEEMAVRRDDGVVIPISLSCNWVQVDGVPIAQAIMRDVTQIRQMQRELQNYAEQLEDRVAARTRELSQSEDRYRTLFLQEQSRAQHLALINEVQQCALATRDINEFLHQVTNAIQGHFRHSDVSVSLCRESPRALLVAPAHRVLDAATILSNDLSAFDGSSLDANAASNADTNDIISEEENDAPSSDLSGEKCEYLVVVAQTGGHGLAPSPGSMVRVEAATPLYDTFYRGALHFQNDVAQSKSSTRFAGDLRDSAAEIYVPIKIENRIVGVLQVQSERANSFDPRDAVALQTASLIVSSHVQSSRMFHEMSELKEFNETVVGTMSHSLMVVGGEMEIELVNDRFAQTWRHSREALIGRHVVEVLGEQVCEKYDLPTVLRDVMRDGFAREIPEVRVWIRTEEALEVEQVFDLRLSRVYFRGQARAVVLFINLTSRWRKTQQLQLMNEMGRLFQASLDINRVLHTVLTCITAGPALGFNRAFLLLFDDESELLRGAMALGPSSADEASHIWSEMGQRQMSLQEMLSDETGFDVLHPTPLQQSTLEVALDLDNSGIAPLKRAVYEKRALKATRTELAVADLPCEEGMSDSLLALLASPETAIAPLVAKERIVGVVLADNLYSNAPIDDDDLRLLDTVAQQAGLTVDNALTYQALQKAQKELVSAERLVAVGEMAARVSHEIRNPLATIGGFARNILKHPEKTENVVRKTNVIVGEVERLEELLTDLLDMARPRQLDLEPNNINDVVEHAILLAGSDFSAANADVKKELSPDLPLVRVDRRRLLQALLNTLRNGAQAMPEGGMIFVATRIARHSENRPPMLEIEIRDTGVGIPEKALKQIFDPFFSTKIRGSGLGLAVTLRIIRDHGGDIDVYSENGQGTVFVMSLPLRLVEEK